MTFDEFHAGLEALRSIRPRDAQAVGAFRDEHDMHSFEANRVWWFLSTGTWRRDRVWRMMLALMKIGSGAHHQDETGKFPLVLFFESDKERDEFADFHRSAYKATGDLAVPVDGTTA